MPLLGGEQAAHINMTRVPVSDAGDGQGGQQRQQRERVHLLLIDDARRGLDDIEAGHTCSADAAIAKLQQRRARHTPTPHAAKSPGKA